MTQSPIFIVGCDRSGTTLLRLMLIQSPILHIPQESMFIYLLKKNPEIYGDFTQSYQRWFFIRDLQTNPATPESVTFPIFNLTLEEAETALAKIAPTNIAQAISTLFVASAKKFGKQRWGDKTPRHVKHISPLAAAFPDAKFVHIIRDGRDVAMSIRKVRWVNNMIEAGQYWCDRVQAGRLAAATLPEHRYTEIYYESLVLEPEKTLQHLCRWLDLEYTPQMLKYYQDANQNISQEHSGLFELISKPVEPSRVQAWKRSLSPEEITDFESVAGDLLVKLGYELSGAKIPLQIQAIRQLRRNIEPLTYKIRRTLKKF